jgi:hypothetical protein
MQNKKGGKKSGRGYLLISGKSSEILTVLPKSEIKSTVQRVFNLVSKTITLKRSGKAENSPLILSFRATIYHATSVYLLIDLGV